MGNALSRLGRKTPSIRIEAGGWKSFIDKMTVYPALQGLDSAARQKIVENSGYDSARPTTRVMALG
ncbi:MAG: hypothetical protein LUC93_01835, partial [Planctomycetaceae bacterium]|nr:hypothetical protein [Planctomycetaceae bacterium]